MKTIIFLGSKNFGDKNNAGDLAQLIGENLGDEYQLQHYYFEDLLFHISNTKRSIVHTPDGCDLKTADLVVALNWYPTGKRSLRDIAYTVALYLAEHDVPFWNSEMLKQRSTTKLSSAWQLAQLGIAIPETMFALNHETLIQAWPRKQTIVKGIATSRGRLNYLTQSRRELETTLQSHPAVRFMVQEFVPNDYDLRLVCLGGELRLAIKRQRTDKGTHLNNTSQGATATLLPLEELPQKILKEAKTVCSTMGRELAGIDYLVANDGSGRYICLEVNAIPQLSSGSYRNEKNRAFADAIKALMRKD